VLSDQEQQTSDDPADAVALGAGDRVVAIVNPGTRAHLGRITAALLDGAPSGVVVDIFQTTRQGDGRELSLAHGANARLLIAVGGDGTVGEVAEGAVEHGVPLGIVPGGSTNIIGRELGIPTASGRAIALLYGKNRLRTIDVGRANGLLFLHMAGAGIDSLMFDLTNPRWKKRVGWMAYVPAAAQALARPAPCFHIRAEGQELRERAPLVLIANGPSIIHPRIRLDPSFEIDDGWLDLMVATATTPIALARTLGRLATLQLRKSPYIQRVPARRIEIDSDPPVPFQIDGDVALQTPVTVTILPLAIRIVVPA
jgi:YegS/Rv2252/BmrU family lipid kinase